MIIKQHSLPVIGAILGDMVGAPYELKGHRIKKVDFPFLSEESTFTDEGNVTFEIYDKDNNIIKSITTDSNGYATFNLSYGTYTLKQINSIEGYEKIEPIKIIVKDIIFSLTPK